MLPIAIAFVGVLSLGLMFLPIAGRSAEGSARIRAVHSHLPCSDIVSRFTPLAQTIKHAVGRRVVVLVGGSHAEPIEAMGIGSALRKLATVRPGVTAFVPAKDKDGLRALMDEAGVSKP